MGHCFWSNSDEQHVLLTKQFDGTPRASICGDPTVRLGPELAVRRVHVTVHQSRFMHARGLLAIALALAGAPSCTSKDEPAPFVAAQVSGLGLRLVVAQGTTADVV